MKWVSRLSSVQSKGKREKTPRQFTMGIYSLAKKRKTKRTVVARATASEGESAVSPVLLLTRV